VVSPGRSSDRLLPAPIARDEQFDHTCYSASKYQYNRTQWCWRYGRFRLTPRATGVWRVLTSFRQRTSRIPDAIEQDQSLASAAVFHCEKPCSSLLLLSRCVVGSREIRQNRRCLGARCVMNLSACQSRSRATQCRLTSYTG
jgi:hypothetical protein